MNKYHLIGLLIIAIAIGVIISVGTDASTYVTFKEAQERMKKDDFRSLHIVGTLEKNTDGKITGLKYEPEKNPNLFSFLLTDTTGITKQVVYHSPKPQDFEKSEKIVVIGKMKGEVFDAEKILMKCPSKYTQNEPR